jgi:hypothetical protein
MRLNFYSLLHICIYLYLFKSIVIILLLPNGNWCRGFYFVSYKKYKKINKNMQVYGSRVSAE